MSSAVSSGIPQRRRTLRAIALAAEPYLYTAPALLLIAAVMLTPLAIGISYAFRDIELLNPMSGGFVGLEHFRELWADPNFWNALNNTVWWTVASVVLQFAFGMILALLLNQPFRGRGLVQALVFLPWAVPAFLSGLDWAWLFNPVVGPLPRWLFALGLRTAPDNIVSDPDAALRGPIVANVWWGTPFFAITMLAALQSIPGEIYEAAAIDGAGPFRRFRDVTLPFLAPTIAIAVLLRAAADPARHRRDPGLRFHRRLERAAVRPDADLEKRQEHVSGRPPLLRQQVLRRLRANDGGRRHGPRPRLPVLRLHSEIPSARLDRRSGQGLMAGG
jgi:multiple sugar transport system permease protein